MHRFWNDVIKPIFKAEQIKTIVEIGSDKGYHTEKLLQYAKENNGMLYAVDPVPSFPAKQLESSSNGHFKMYEDLSLNVLPKLKKADVFLIDGDHNWYTVYNELKCIKDNFSPDKFPLILFHDICWPYDRRDLYYNPDNIPAEYRHAYSRKGMSLHNDALQDVGINQSFFNANTRNNERNGVKTAVEDFVKDYPEYGLTLYCIEALNGLGMIASSKYQKAIDIFTDASTYAKVLKLAEEYRVTEQLERYTLRNEINQLKSQNKDCRFYDAPKLYVDYGDGFSEKNAIVSDITSINNGIFRQEYCLDKKAVNIRFDPVHNAYCMVDGLCAATENGSIEPSSNNGWESDGIYYFDCFDSQIIFNKVNTRRLTITAQIYPFKNLTALYAMNNSKRTLKNLDQANKNLDEANKKLNEANKSIQENKASYEKKIEELFGQIKDAEQSCLAIKADYNKHVAEHNEKTANSNRRIAECEAQMQNYTEEISRSQKIISDYEEKFFEYSQKINQADQCINDYKAQIAEYSSKISHADECINDYKTQIAEYNVKLRQSDECIADCNNQISQYSATLDSRNKYIKECEEKIAEYESANNDYCQQTKRYQAEIEKLKVDIFNKRIDVDRVSSKLDDYAEKLQHYKEQLSFREQVIDSYKEKLDKDLYAIQEKDKAVAAAKQEKDKAVAAAKQEKDKAVAAAKQEKDKAVAAAKQEKDKAIAAAKQEKDKAIAAAKQENAKLQCNIANLNGELKRTNSDLDSAAAANQKLLQMSNAKGLKFAMSGVFKRGLRATAINLKGIKDIRNSGCFDPAWYYSHNKDVLDSKIDPLVHYVWFGGYENRDPSADFDSAQYLKFNTDVKESKINPLVHYVRYGRDEGRSGKIVLTPTPIATTATHTASSIAQTANKNAQPVAQPVSQNAHPAAQPASQNAQPATQHVAEPINIKFGIDNLVSIIMPTWNRESVICNAVDSVLRQTYQNFELIIVDDGSQDNTESLIKEKYSAELSEGKIVYIKQPNSGVCAARNLGLKNVKGYYTAYLDSDNAWHSDYLNTMVNAFITHPEIQTAYCDIHVFDKVHGQEKVRDSEYRRKVMINQNFIDLNVFMHKTCLYYQYGGFDTNLRRLVDWDLIVRYTNTMPAYHVKKVLADYFIENGLNNISTTVSLDDNRMRVLKKNRRERMAYDWEPVNVAYILWDYPAGSQTFVFNEIKYLVENGCNVMVFYKVVAKNYKEPDIKLNAIMVKDENELAEKLVEYDIDYMHAHFAYPTAYQLAYKASKLTGIPYSFAAHAVDIFLYVNDRRNHVDEVGQYDKCEMILVPGGKFHLDFLKKRGVPANKIAIVNQVVADDFLQYKATHMNDYVEFSRDKVKIVAIGRFIEKKGFEYLIKAAAMLDERFSIDIYGYGDLEADYKALIEQYDTHHIVKLCGTIPNAIECLKTADILAAPCVVAENGDIDGMPTVVLEAMATGTMVVATDVSSIPYVVKDGYNGFVVGERDEKALAEKILYVNALPDEEKRNIIRNGYNSVGDNKNTKTMASALLDNILQKRLSIFMVTYCDGDFSETKSIIENLFEKTVSKFNLTIVDNNSSNPEFITYLKKLECERPNVNIVFSKKNLWCGPASNLALSTFNTDYAIYICSNEGYVVEYGWEKKFMDYMDQHPNCAMAGAYSYSPKLYDRSTYSASEVFKSFRNRDFINKINEPIRFIQGGLYILRMDAFKKVGGFSDKLVHGHMDVEYSYYLQSCGYDIGCIEGICAGTKTTLPKPSDFADDMTVAIHPYTKNQLTELENAVSNKKNICSVCGFVGEFKHNTCPHCSSKSTDRCLYKYLSTDVSCYNPGYSVDFAGYTTDSKAFKDKLTSMFKNKGKKSVAITSSLSTVSNSCETIVLVCDSLDYNEPHWISEYEKSICQYYSAAAAYDMSKIVVYKRKK